VVIKVNLAGSVNLGIIFSTFDEYQPTLSGTYLYNALRKFHRDATMGEKIMLVFVINIYSLMHVDVLSNLNMSKSILHYFV
jgi:hypothetical protein